MKGDFSRVSFDAKKHFSSVLMQQGRVSLDADPNEEGAILLHYLRTLARDLIGPRGGPSDNLGFELTLDETDHNHPKLMIGKGRYYVDGILVEIDENCDYAHQPDSTPDADDALLRRLNASDGEDVWVYLDVWERHVTWIEDDSIREPALDGPDTCSRAKVVWQVRAIARDQLLATLTTRRDEIAARIKQVPVDTDESRALQVQLDSLAQDINRLTVTNGQGGMDCTAPLDALGLSDAQMTARLDPGQQIKDACAVSPDALYRGAENQLYRVELHRGTGSVNGPTFKWSRENGSIATRWLGTEGNDVMVTNGRGFTAGAWIELTDDSNEVTGHPGILVKLTSVDGDRLSVDPASIPTTASIAFTQALRHAKVRRWDQTERDDITLDEGAVPLLEVATNDANWLTLENGIQVQFASGGSYRSGDYWLIPARSATGSILWPHTIDTKGDTHWQARSPDGVEHHYAPLGFIGANSDSALSVTPCLCEIAVINSCGQQRINRDTAVSVSSATAKQVRARKPNK